MLIKRPSDIPPSEITPEPIYRRRRELMQAAAAGAIIAATGWTAGGARAATKPAALEQSIAQSRFSTPEKPNTWEAITEYNNYYEFGTGKSDPAENAHRLKTRPWEVVVDGEVAKPRTFSIEELLKLPLEERIYRLRCVEAWSMVIPWVGFEFNKLAALVEPTSRAKFVEFTTVLQPENMPGTRRQVLDWPYVEGLRIDLGSGKDRHSAVENVSFTIARGDSPDDVVEYVAVPGVIVKLSSVWLKTTRDSLLQPSSRL